MPYQGLKAASISGCSRILRTPIKASTLNQHNMTGPNKRPTTAEPFFCTKNNPNRTSKVNGNTNGCSAGAPTSSPSTADSTDIAGVTMPSP